MFTLLSKLFPFSLTMGEDIVNWYENSLIKELLDYFNERYFSVELGSYENFSVSAGTAVTVRNIILALAAAIIVAALTTAYTRVRLGAFVRKLLTENCLSEEQAKSLMELGYFRNPSIRKALSRPSAFQGVVRRVGDGLPIPPVVTEEDLSSDAEDEVATEEDGVSVDETEIESAEDAVLDESDAENATRIAEKKEKIDFTTARFYVPYALCSRAEARFDPNGSSWKSAVIVSVASIVVAALLCFFVPELIRFADNLIGWLGT